MFKKLETAYLPFKLGWKISTKVLRFAQTYPKNWMPTLPLSNRRIKRANISSFRYLAAIGTTAAVNSSYAFISISLFKLESFWNIVQNRRDHLDDGKICDFCKCEAMAKITSFFERREFGPNRKFETMGVGSINRFDMISFHCIKS